MGKPLRRQAAGDRRGRSAFSELEVWLPLGFQAADRQTEPVLWRNRPAREAETDVVDQPVLLARVAPPAGRHHVVPRVRAAARSGHDMVQVLGGRAAVLTGPLVAREHGPAGKRRVRAMGDLHEGPQAQDRGRVDVQALGSEDLPVGDQDLGLLLQHQDHGPSRSHHREWLVRRVEHERSSHGASIRGLSACTGPEMLATDESQGCNPRGGGGRPRSKDAWKSEQGAARGVRPRVRRCRLHSCLPRVACRPSWAGCRRNRGPTLDVLLSKMVRRRSAEVRLEAREPTLDWQRFAEGFRVIEQNVEKVVQGKQPEIRLALAALIAEGHILIEDVPGVGKTMLAKAIARSIDCSFRRIQFTPDLLPTDVTGVNVFNQERGDFEFKPGAIFANIVLGDEINRASPKTQSALLECMEERQVTIDTETYQLGQPFMVIATQNPIEHEGTYPLPEAQLDRFMMRIAIGYPSADVEAEILATHGVRSTLTDIGPVTDALGVREMIDMARQVHVSPPIRRYIVDIVEATRLHGDVYLGASPRASIMLLRAARAMAAADERDYVIPDDVKGLALAVLSHRVIVTVDAVMSGRTAGAVLAEVINEVTVPVTGKA